MALTAPIRLVRVSCTRSWKPGMAHLRAAQRADRGQRTQQVAHVGAGAGEVDVVRPRLRDQSIVAGRQPDDSLVVLADLNGRQVGGSLVRTDRSRTARGPAVFGDLAVACVAWAVTRRTVWNGPSWPTAALICEEGRRSAIWSGSGTGGLPVS